MAKTKKLRVGLVMPHIFMHKNILPHVIFAPGQLAINLANELHKEEVDVTFFTPGPVNGQFRNVWADLSYFEAELAARGDSYMELLKKHPFTFITLARQVQSEIIAAAYEMANKGLLDVVHIYGNEEDIALPFAKFCKVPVVFTHHDPYNFLVKYRSVFPKYKDLNWLSLSLAQRKTMPSDTNWVGNIYHGLDPGQFKPNYHPKGDYVAYLGRIIEPKGVHLAISAAKQAGLKIKIAGKHYSGNKKDTYWQQKIMPELGEQVKYVGYLKTDAQKQEFLGNAEALIIPSVFDEPFGMVMVEALACGTPLIGLDSGAVPEVIKSGENGILVKKAQSEAKTADNIAKELKEISKINRKSCRHDFENRFTLDRMCQEHIKAYRQLFIS